MTNAMNKTYIAHLVSVSPYTAYRLHIVPDGRVFIPPFLFKEALVACGRYLGMKTGKGKATYAKHLRAGVLISEGLLLPLTVDKIEWLSIRGIWCRAIHEWEGDLTIHVLDDETITPEILRFHLAVMGAFIGIGSFQPINRGPYSHGLFRLEGFGHEPKDLN